MFGPIVQTPKDANLVGYKCVFVRKMNEIIIYKARLVAQCFLQKLVIDYEEIYSVVMDTTTFRYLISLTVSQNVKTRLMDVVIAYLYGDLDTKIHIKIPE